MPSRDERPVAGEGFGRLGGQRQGERGRVDVPALAAVDLQHEDVVGVVVRGEALRSGRRDVGVALGAVAELGGEPAAEAHQRRVDAVQRVAG